MPDLDKLKTVLSYSPDTGEFTWLKSNCGLTGKRAGSVHHSGYRRVRALGAVYAEHRLAWLFMHGKLPEFDLDHINRCKQDNRIANLREANDLMNCQNKGLSRNNKSGFRGVHWCKRHNKWRASIRVNWKLINIGRYDTAEQAFEAYKAASKIHHPFANLEE